MSHGPFKRFIGEIHPRTLWRHWRATKKTLFLWEGVTLYLAEEDVRRTLRDVHEHAAPGSVVVADFYAERFIRIGSGSLAKKTLAYTDETLGFGLPFATDYEQNLQRFVSSEGLTVGETVFMGSWPCRGQTSRKVIPARGCSGCP